MTRFGGTVATTDIEFGNGFQYIFENESQNLNW